MGPNVDSFKEKEILRFTKSSNVESLKEQERPINESPPAVGIAATNVGLFKEQEQPSHGLPSSAIRVMNNSESLKDRERPGLGSRSSSVIFTPMDISQTLKRKLSDVDLRFTFPSNKRRHLSEDQNIPTGPRYDVNIERVPIWRKVKSCPFVFIRKYNIEVSEKNLYQMGQMVKGASFDAHVRADNTGFFIVFEKSVDGERFARECLEHFKGTKFYGIPMKLELYVHGRREGG
jgi:hypothetical protein